MDANRPINLAMDGYDPDAFANSENRPKKKKRDTPNWKRNIAKKARIKGTELKDVNGRTVVKARPMRNVECSCGCYEQLSEIDKEFIYDTFHAKGSHELQNEYLRGCTEVAGIQHLNNGKERRIFTHKLHFQRRTVVVCQNVFVGVHGINRSRLRKKVLERETDIADGRGKHPNHRMRTSHETRDLIRIFLKSLPARQSHYSLKKNPGRLYMDSHWSITLLFKEFFKYFPEVTQQEATLIVFRDIFNTEFNIKFGFPRTDKCDTCSKFLSRLSSLRTLTPENIEEIDETTREHERHLEYSEIFYTDLSGAKLFEDNHFALCMDYQQNMPIPVTRVNKEFYLRQLWVYNFGIKNIKTGNTTMFLYSETFAKKGANEVVSCLLWYINNVVPAHVTILTIFCDNPTGQNKNRFIYSALQYLANTRFERVYVKYPVPGHSRMPIDGDFGLIELKMRKQENIFSPDDIVRVVKSSRTEVPFDVAYVNSPFTDNLCCDGTPIVIIKDYKSALEPLFEKRGGSLDLNSIRELRFCRNALPTANFTDRFSATSRNMSIFANGVTGGNIAETIVNARSMHDDFLPIRLPKLSNLETLRPHIQTRPGTIFFDTVYAFEKDGYRRYLQT